MRFTMFFATASLIATSALALSPESKANIDSKPGDGRQQNVQAEALSADLNWFAIIGASVGVVGSIVGVVGGAIGFMNRRDADKFRRLTSPWVELISRGTGEDGGRLITIRIANDEKSLWKVASVKVATPKGGLISEATETYPDPVLGGEPTYAANKWSRELVDNIGGLQIVKPNTDRIELRVTIRSRADPSIKLIYNAALKD